MQLYAVRDFVDGDDSKRCTSPLYVLSAIVLDLSAAHQYRWLGAPKGVAGCMTWLSG